MTYQISYTAPFFLLGGVLSIACFYLDTYFPIWVSCAIMVGVGFYTVRLVLTKKIGMALGVTIGVYLLPFIHTASYIFIDFSEQYDTGFGGLLANPYMFDEKIISLMAMFGATGALGIGLACSLNILKLTTPFSTNRDKSKTLSVVVWLVWLLVGFSFAIISAPEQTIFTSQYAQSDSISQGLNLSSAWMISFAVLTYLYVDYLLEYNPKIKKVKKIFIYLGIIYVAVWLGLIHGDRESISWVFGLIMVRFLWIPIQVNAYRSLVSWQPIFLTGVILFVVAKFVGDIRHELSGLNLFDIISVLTDLINTDMLGFHNILGGTWSAVLLTPLSVAGDYVNGLLSMNWGEDYLNLIKSILPGLIADVIGYERPLGVLSGPAWEMRYGIGGTHALVVPFRSFFITGIFLVAFLWAFWLNIMEKKMIKKRNVVNVSFLCIMVMVAPHWVWYGEKAGINAIIIWLLLSYLYRISLSIRYYKDVSKYQVKN